MSEKVVLPLLNEEKIQIARETNRIHLPREINIWLKSLDLSYKIKNPQRDLANGFCIAEILSRYPVPHATEIQKSFSVVSNYRVNMKEFSNGSSKKERSSNWKHIRYILRSIYCQPVTDELISQVCNHAPNAAFELIIMLHKILTKRDVKLLNRVDETNKFRQYSEMDALPKFMRPTASLLVRDHEIQRIDDNLVREYKLEEILKSHKDYLAGERIGFIKQKEEDNRRKKLKQIQRKEEEGSKQQNAQNQLTNSGNINDNIKEANESDSQLLSDKQKEEKINLMGLLTEVVSQMKENENVDSEFRQMIKKNFIETDRNIELELKNYSEDKDIIEFFFEKLDQSPELFTDEHYDRIFLSYKDKDKDFIGIISRTFIELIPFIKLICRFFDAFYRNGIMLWKSFGETTKGICESVRKSDPDKCDTIFINFCLDTVLDMITVNPLYRNEMCQIIFTLATNTSDSHYNILKRISKKFANTDELLFYHILVQCMNTIKEGDEILTEDIVFFYNDVISKGITSSCDIIKIKSIYLVNQFMRFDYFYCLGYHENIFKHINTWNWEILSLILIYCSKMLELFNRQKLEREQFKESLNEKSLAKLENMADIEGMEKIEKVAETNQDDKKIEEELNFRIEEISKNEPKFLVIIDTIFNVKSPHMTIKIGFIYLAEILEYYPSLAKKYIKLLIEYKDSTIRKEVLKVNQSEEEYEYTINCYTERYKYCGAPDFWNQLVVAGIFRDYVKENLERFEAAHLLILHSIIINQEFNEAESEQWIVLYNDLKKYLFVALCEKDFSNIALSICNKIFSFEKILKELLESTFDSLISTMKIIYSDDIIEQPHENMETLLTFISELKSEKNDCKEYIYLLIKTFAIQNDKIYLKSNLLGLLNSIYDEKRGAIFD